MKLKAIISLCSLHIFSNTLSIAQFDKIVKDATLQEAEFSVAINPINNNNIVIATMYGLGNQTEGDRINIYYTNDFGDTWTKSSFHGMDSGHEASGDPVLAFDANGDVLLTNLVIAGNGIDAILSKSTDGGATWNIVSTIATLNTDKPWLAIDTYNSSPYKGNIYIPLVENQVNLYTLDNSYQTNSSVTLSNASHLPSVVVKKNGDVFVSAVQFFGNTNRIYIAQYNNGGTNFVHSSFVDEFPDYTFDAPDVSQRFQPTAYLAMDNSGGLYDGRLYLTYTASENINPDYFNVFITYSDDDGQTWSTPKVVHSDQQSEVQQFYSSSYVNSNGVLIVDWYDRTNYSNTNKQTDFFIGVSKDGGSTFEELQLTSASSNFDFVIPANDDFGIGEYHQVVATNDYALSFWCDGRTNDGDLNIYMAKINLNGPVTMEEKSIISDKITISSLYPQPANEVLFANVNMKEDAVLQCQVSDINGKIIHVSDWLELNAGSNTIDIPANQQAGVYFVTFKSKAGYLKTIRFVKG